MKRERERERERESRKLNNFKGLRSLSLFFLSLIVLFGYQNCSQFKESNDSTKTSSTLNDSTKTSSTLNDNERAEDTETDDNEGVTQKDTETEPVIPVLTIYDNKTVTIEEGASVRFSVSVKFQCEEQNDGDQALNTMMMMGTGDPSCPEAYGSVDWYKVSDSGEDLHLIRKGVGKLYISRVTMLHGGVYYAVATSSTGHTARSENMTLLVKDNPDEMYSCNLAYHIHRNGLSGGTCDFDNAENQLLSSGTDIPKIEVIYVGREIKILSTDRPEVLSVNLGSDVTLKAMVESKTNTTFFGWHKAVPLYKDPNVLRSSYTQQPNVDVLLNLVNVLLNLKDVQYSDEGYYYFEADNSSGTARSQLIYLAVFKAL